MKLLNFLCPEELAEQHQKAWKILLYKSQADALRNAMRQQVKEAQEKSRNFVEGWRKIRGE